MKQAILTLMCMGTAYVRGECVYNEFADTCWDDPYIANIVCTGVDGCACNIYDTDPEENACLAITAEGMDDLTAPGLTGGKCEEICEASKLSAVEEADKCEFFRWETNGSGNSHCTLMSADQCGEFKNCERGQCLSGQAGCGGGVSPVPDTAKCVAEVVFNPDAVHWQCINTATNPNEHFNIYGTEKAPSGVHCWTAHKCKAFDDETPLDDPNDFENLNTLHVKCITDIDGTTWGQFPGSTNDVTTYINVPLEKLIDPVCITKPEPLVLAADKLHEPGVSFICDNKLDFTENEVTVTADNTCALLCNFQHAFTIENELDEYGNGVWNRYEAGSDEPEVVDADAPDVKCWDFMKM